MNLKTKKAKIEQLVEASKFDKLYDQHLEGKILVLNAKNLAPWYRKPENALWRAIGGFGCSPTANGTCVLVENVVDPKLTARFERYDFIGIYKEQVV